jgi:hypothetical protein
MEKRYVFKKSALPHVHHEGLVRPMSPTLLSHTLAAVCLRLDLEYRALHRFFPIQLAGVSMRLQEGGRDELFFLDDRPWCDIVLSSMLISSTRTVPFGSPW